MNEYCSRPAASFIETLFQELVCAQEQQGPRVACQDRACDAVGLCFDPACSQSGWDKSTREYLRKSDEIMRTSSHGTICVFHYEDSPLTQLIYRFHENGQENCSLLNLALWDRIDRTQEANIENYQNVVRNGVQAS